MNIHLVAFNIPFPANYGGAIDVFCKIKALRDLGVKVHLHCFKYDRSESKELNQLCERVYYYARELKKRYVFSDYPFIVISRANEQLLNNLLQDNHPIIFEGLHTCYWLNDKRLTKRLKLVRMHNIEHTYYDSLAEHGGSVLKKIYYKNESKKLKKFENILHHATAVLAISEADTNALSARYNNVLCIGAFHQNEEVSITPGQGGYCLYHGNLSVSENNAVAMYLVKNIFSKISIPFIVAGQNPSRNLQRAIQKVKHVQLLQDVSEARMRSLIKNAQINILPAAQATGIKLKLLNALHNGRHCLVNNTMIDGTGLETLCSIANSDEEIISAINCLFVQPVNAKELGKRKKVLKKHFSNEDNAHKIMNILGMSLPLSIHHTVFPA